MKRHWVNIFQGFKSGLVFIIIVLILYCGSLPFSLSSQARSIEIYNANSKILTIRKFGNNKNFYKSSKKQPQFSTNISVLFRTSLAPSINLFFDIKEVNIAKQINIYYNDPPSAIKIAYQQCLEESKNRHYEEAARQCSMTLQKEEFAEAYVSRGRVHAELGNWQKALSDYQTALKVKPKFINNPNLYVDPLIGMGWVNLELGNSQVAFENFSQALKLNSNFWQVYLGRAGIYAERGEYQNALSDLELALQSNPDYPEAFLLRGSIELEIGEYQKAVRDFTRLLKSNSKSAKQYKDEAYYNRAIAYLHLGDSLTIDNYKPRIFYQKALDNLNEIDWKRKDENVFYQRALAYYKLRQWRAAIRNLDYSLSRNPNYADAYRQKGMARLNLKEYSKARRDLTQAIGLNPNDGQSYFFRGQAYSYLKDCQRSEWDFAKARSLAPDYQTLIDRFQSNHTCYTPD